ncbi:PREDICTED: dual oxidase-like [Priapulus caudatus]|uniref:Dual oxidase-like n=1 Tax=Priapulus caudatus TaxID=37621 RepID=A0ABM1EA25_PRICU|nr:PREDICTED: dual oxidase-like [Priapulus caudatus]
MVDEDVYMKARRMVVATMQSIFLYEYLPALLNEPTDEYKGYDTDIYPGVTTEFHAAAFRYGHTHIPPGFYLRDSMCRFRPNPIRLCNTYFDASAAIKMYGIEEVLMGMASQIAEKEDTILIDDLRGELYRLRTFRLSITYT